jgi:DNA-binding transcriptional LysR family regulator
VSQSAVSRQISLLEDYLHVKLFNRESTQPAQRCIEGANTRIME